MLMMKRRQDGNDNKWDVVRSDRRTIAFIGAPGDRNSHDDDDDDDDDPLVSMLHSCSQNNGRYDGLRENTLVLFEQLFAPHISL